MAKIIKLTQECKEKLQKDFEEYLENNTLEDGKFSFSRVFESADEKAKIVISPLAYIKMVSLLSEFNKEVAWHGEAYRGEDNTYYIKDVMVYPQTVTGSTVEMDTDEYANWIIDNITDERFDNIRMQAHSHVNMGTSPSGIDLQHQSEIVNQLGDDGFYIFMIWNKSLNNTNKIYDMQKNIMFEDKDITIEIALGDFISEAKEMVVEKTYYTPYYYKKPSNDIKNDSKFKSKEKAKNDKKKEVATDAKDVEDEIDFIGWKAIDRYLDEEFIREFEEDLPWQ